MSHPQTVPGLILAASSSNSGKTTLSLGLQRLLERRGLLVAPAKCAPTILTLPFMRWLQLSVSQSGSMGDATLGSCLAQSQSGTIQGHSVRLKGSWAFLMEARWWRWLHGQPGQNSQLPIFLVLDVKGQAQTAAAIAAGIRDHDRDINIAGVILNRVGSSMHVSLLREAFEKVGLPVVGTVRQSDAL